MKRILLIIIISNCIACSDNKHIESKKPSNSEKNNSNIESKQPIYPNAYSDTLNEKTTNKRIKFAPGITLNDFKVDAIDHKKYAALDLYSLDDAIRFRTQIRRAFSSETANFAGHYTIAIWGCGSPCQSSVLIDRKTGKIYESPSASLKYNFQVDSRMLIVNPPDSADYYSADCFYCKPIIYIFNEETKTFTETEYKTAEQE
ncbi:MAG: hypothetical protein ACHQFW_05230 [Chitinophagales bacterium]